MARFKVLCIGSSAVLNEIRMILREPQRQEIFQVDDFDPKEVFYGIDVISPVFVIFIAGNNLRQAKRIQRLMRVGKKAKYAHVVLSDFEARRQVKILEALTSWE